MRYADFFDHFFLKLYNGDHKRTFFPVILETTDSRFFNVDLKYNLRIGEEDLAFIELER